MDQLVEHVGGVVGLAELRVRTQIVCPAGIQHDHRRRARLPQQGRRLHLSITVIRTSQTIASGRCWARRTAA